MDGFRGILTGLLSQDNAVRRGAEEFYTREMTINAAGGLSLLLQMLQDKTADALHRSFAGVLLRQAIEKYSSALPADGVSQIRATMLELWATEADTQILTRLTHALAQSAAQSGWTELIPSLLAQVGSMQPTNVQSFLSLVEKIADYRPSDIQANINTLGGFLAQSLSSPESIVAVASAKATGAAILALEDEGIRSSFRAALPPILTVLGATLSRNDEHDATNIMQHLIGIAQSYPIFFKGNVDALVGAMLSVAGAEGFEFSTRNVALELMVTLTESAPAMARRCAGLVQGLVPLAMSLMLEVEDEDSEWAQGIYAPQSIDDDDNYLVGEDAIERAASGMGGRILSPVIFAGVQEWSQSPEWRRRRAAIVSLVRLAEGAVEVFKAQLPNALNFLETALADASPRVQYEAVQAVGQFSLLFPESSTQIVARFLPLLTRGLKTVTMCQKVRGHCAAAMINMTNPETCDAETLEPHMSSLLEALLASLQTAPIQVQSHCLVLLGFVAQVSEEAFVPYYQSFMPGVKSILTSAAGEGMEELRGKAMECAGLIGEAVGDEVFSADAMEIMQLLLTVMHAGDMSRSSDVVFDSILPACASIAKALGDKFVQFLPFVMGPLLEGANRVIEFSMTNATEEEAAAEAEHDETTGMDSAVIPIAGVYKRVTLNTHAVQQKTKACSMIFEYAAALKGNMGQFMQPSLHALIPCITDKHSPEMRSSASLGVARVFEAYVDSAKRGATPPAEVTKVMDECMSRLINALAGENNDDARASAAEAFRDILQACYESSPENVDGTRNIESIMVRPSLESAQANSKRLLSLAAECVKRRAEKEHEFISSEVLEDEDRGAFEEEIEMEEELLSNLVDAIGQYIKLHREAFMGHFNTSIAPAFLPYLSPDQPKALQIVAVCMMDDAIEFGGKGMDMYLRSGLPLFLQNLSSDDNVLRQSSSYGIAQICKEAPAFAAANLRNIIPALMTLIQSPEARDSDNEGTTENALFALGCLIGSAAPTLKDPVAWAGVDRSQVGETWLKGLPLMADESEAKSAHHQLCNAIDTMDATVLGEQMSRLSDVVRVLASVLVSTKTHGKDDTALATPATVQRMQLIASQIRTMVPADQLTASCVFLTDKQLTALQWAQIPTH